MIENTSGLPIPRYNLKRIFQLRGKLQDDVLIPYYGCTATGTTLDEMANKIADALPRVRIVDVRTSLEPLSGYVLDTNTLHTVAWQLAGCIDELQAKQKIVLSIFTQLYVKSWVPVQVCECTPVVPIPDMRNDLSLRILAGPYSAQRVHVQWSTAFCRMLARRAGFTAAFRKYPFRVPAEFVSLRFMLLIDDGIFCRMLQAGCTSSMLAWNRRLIGMRNRTKNGQLWPCPRQFTHPCCECPIGYNDCPCGVHADTWQEIPQTQPVAAVQALPASCI